MIDRPMLRKGSGGAGTGSSNIQFTRKLEIFTNFEKIKMCFLCQIVNKDNNTPKQRKYSIKKYAAMARLFKKPFQQSQKRLFVLQ